MACLWLSADVQAPVLKGRMGFSESLKNMVTFSLFLSDLSKVHTRARRHMYGELWSQAKCQQAQLFLVELTYPTLVTHTDVMCVCVKRAVQ